MGKKVLLFIITFFTVAILGAGSYAFQYATSTASSITEEIDNHSNQKFKDRLENISLKNGDPISVLIMGIDKPVGEERGRSDSLVLLTLNPHSKSMQMVSIPRDTYTKIKGPAEDKINSAYHEGGTEMTISSVENLFDVPVDYFVKVNMKSFKQIVDAVGGVDVNNDLNFTFRNIDYPKGHLHLNGKEALLYSRMRKVDPRGDFGRQKRQRQVMEAVIDKGASISSVTKYGEMLKVVQNNVKTNMNFYDMWKIQSNYKDARENIEQHKLKGSDKTIKGTYYYIPDKKDLRIISNSLKKHLEMNDHHV
ncbi:LCP family protein [Fictibacillus sp. NRS-1165]|uniref:LCP family glycopolymer transferase n=1 Tax=Fictibacillus sp. NRS-1165 TaxID=3144463 RepID=UPI003D1AB965